MSFPLLVTADVAGRTRRAEAVIRPGQSPGRAVVVTSSTGFCEWTGRDTGEAAWIVLGDVENGAMRPFLQLPADARGAALELAIDRGAELLHLRARQAELQAETALALDRQLELARVGIALTAERDLDTLLRLILTAARELVSADAGSLYLIEDTDGHRLLRFVLAQNDSVAASLVTSSVPLDSTSLAGYVAASGELVTVENVRQVAADLPYRYNASFDRATGYYTRSLLTVPIATRAGEVIGVLQLINRKLDRHAKIVSEEVAEEVVRPFGQREIAVIRALAAQAAVAIENSRLVQEIERLFEGFVRASVTAIEQRDPTTSGHSLRVAHYTLGLAHALEHGPPPAYSGVRFSPDELTQLRYAALLHDFGKVGVREAVLTKGKKLFPERLALVEERFRHARRAREVELLRTFVRTLVENGTAPTPRDLELLAASFGAMGMELDEHLAAVLIANEPTVLDEATAHLLVHAGIASFPREDGQAQRLLTPEEVRALSVPRGSLDEEERREMESHVVHSYQFLLTLPWPRRFARVPAIAYGHHEKLNGRGYPNRLIAEAIPLEVRLMTVSDIFDALSSGDRPYKRALSIERALGVIEGEAAAGMLDADIVRLFIDARVYARPLAD